VVKRNKVDGQNRSKTGNLFCKVKKDIEMWK